MVVDVLTQGGIFVYIALAVGALGGLVALLAALVIGFAKWRVPMTLGWLGLTLGVMTCAVGSVLARSSFSLALTSAAPESQQRLLAMAISENLYTHTALLFVLTVSFLLFCLTAALPTAIAVGPDARFDVRGMLSAVGGAAVGLMVAIASVAGVLGVGLYRMQGPSSIALPLLAVLVTVAVLVASVRVSDTDRLHQGRVAASRAVITLSAVLAVVLAGSFFNALGIIQAFMAVAVASPDSRTELLAAGLEVAAYATTSGWCWAMMPLTAGIASLLHILGRVEGRQWIGAGVATVQLLVILGGLWFIGSSTRWMFDQMVSVF